MSTFGTLTTTEAIGKVVIRCHRCRQETTHTAFAWTRILTLFRRPVLEVGKRHPIVCSLCGHRRSAAGTLKFHLVQLEILGNLPVRSGMIPVLPYSKAA